MRFEPQHLEAASKKREGKRMLKGELATAIMLVLASTMPLRAQTNHQAISGSPPERIYFSALNKEEKPVLGLTPRDFELRVNGESRPMDDFRPGLPHTDRSIPLVAWILIDFNPNINAAMIKQQASAAADIFKLLHPDSRVGVQVISDRAETLAPLAHDPASLRSALLQFSEHRMVLRAGSGDEETLVGPGGIARATELAIGEIAKFVEADPALANREIHRAVMILSDGNLNPSFKTRPLYQDAGRDGVFLYPVFVPRASIGPWIADYFDLAKKSGGVGSFLGALAPGSNPFAWKGTTTSANALNFNFLHMVRDLNGKYSFTLPLTPGREAKVSLKCRTKGVEIRLPRKTLP